MAAKNNVLNTFNTKKQIARKYWLYGLLEKDSKLYISIPQNFSLAPAKRAQSCFSWTILWFIAKCTWQIPIWANQHLQCRWYRHHNCAKQTVKGSDASRKEGRTEVLAWSSTERGTLVTPTCMNATGNFVPLMFVFPRIKDIPKLMKHSPVDSWAVYYKSKWIQQDMFILRLKMSLNFQIPLRWNQYI